jgi:hypothetical protein
MPQSVETQNNLRIFETFLQARRNLRDWAPMRRRSEISGKEPDARAEWERSLIRELLAAEQAYDLASAQLAKIRAAHPGALSKPEHVGEALGAIGREYVALRRHAQAWKVFSDFCARLGSH